MSGRRWRKWHSRPAVIARSDPPALAPRATVGLSPPKRGARRWERRSNPCLTAALDCFAEPVIGPATLGRTRWLAMTSFRGFEQSDRMGSTLAKSTSCSREFDGFRFARPILTRWASSVPIPICCQGTTGPPPARWAPSRDSSTRRYQNVEQDNNRAGRRNRSRHRRHGIGRDRASPRQRCRSGDL